MRAALHVLKRLVNLPDYTLAPGFIDVHSHATIETSGNTTTTIPYGPQNAGPDYLERPTSCGRTVPSLRKKCPDVPWGLESIARKCLAPDPARRYQRAADLAEDLDRFLNDLPLTLPQAAPEPSPPPPEPAPAAETSGNISRHMRAAWPSTPIPAVTLRQRIALSR